MLAGIFKINLNNDQEEHLRAHINSGFILEGTDVHLFVGLIKTWFQELPTGVLDPLAPKAVIECQSEEDCTTLYRLMWQHKPPCLIVPST
nr:Rho GTPase-activating protein 5-like [Tanacetum cinerariifolium]